MLVIKSDNRSLMRDMSFSFINGNTLSGVSSFGISSTDKFLTDDFVIAGEINDVGSELLQIDSVTDINTIVLKTPSVYAHSESTKITKVPYDKVKFYRNTVPTFSTTTLLATVDINPQSLFTIWNDSVYSTGYAFFVFYNSETDTNSSSSNPIPYTDFPENSAYKIIKNFLSSLNNTESKLISFSDAFSWLNEAYGMFWNAKRLANQELSTQDIYPLTMTGVYEYDLPDIFSKVVSISGADGSPIDYIKEGEIQKEKNYPTGGTKYYLRADKIGFIPLQSTGTINLLYNSKAGKLSSYYDNLECEDGTEYIFTDYLIYKAAPKTGLDRASALSFRNTFLENIKSMTLIENKKDDSKTSWDISPESCT